MNWQNIFYNLRVPDDVRRAKLRALIKRRFHCGTWTTNDKNVIPIHLMRESHLVNAYLRVFRDAMATTDKDVFDMRYDSAALLQIELERRGRFTFLDEEIELKEKFIRLDTSSWMFNDDFGSLDHYEAMHYWRGD